VASLSPWRQSSASGEPLSRTVLLLRCHSLPLKKKRKLSSRKSRLSSQRHVLPPLPSVARIVSFKLFPFLLNSGAKALTMPPHSVCGGRRASLTKLISKLGSTDSRTNNVHSKPFSASIFKFVSFEYSLLSPRSTLKNHSRRGHPHPSQ